MDFNEQLIDTWRIHNRINVYLLSALTEDALGGVSASKGRNVGAVLAHMHNVRLMWLKSAAPELLEGLEKLEPRAALNTALLKSALVSSGVGIEKLIHGGLETGKIKGFKPHPVAFVGYLIAHESYHRGELGLILAQSGHPLDDKVAYGQWEWGVR
jgi:uncharacterized damage-inducible protein DinB